MADALEEMPLFPLNTVLFPYAQLQLHVFEPKYLELIEHCVQNDQDFGVVLVREGAPTEPYLVGTAVRIKKVDRLDGGKLDVRVQGQRRFRIRKLDEDSRAFPVGHVEPVVELEVEDNPRVDALTYRLKECVEEYIRTELRHYDFKIQQISLPMEPTALSFVVANLLKIENLEKQRLLETSETKPVVNKSASSPDKTPATIVQSKSDSSATKAAQVRQPEKIKVPVPPVLRTRTNELYKSIETVPGEIKISLYDNGEIDGDTVSIYHNNRLIKSRQMLSAEAITITLQINEDELHHEIVMVAENLGSIPPNTSVMVINTPTNRYEVFISSNTQKNAKVVFSLKK